MECDINLLFQPEKEILGSVGNQGHWLNLPLTDDRTHLIYQTFVKENRQEYVDGNRLVMSGLIDQPWTRSKTLPLIHLPSIKTRS